jgi:hypothetical protein
MKLANEVYKWAMDNLWNEKEFLYYQILPYTNNKISYLRWSQAWMLLAISTLLENRDYGAKSTHSDKQSTSTEVLT